MMKSKNLNQAPVPDGKVSGKDTEPRNFYISPCLCDSVVQTDTIKQSSQVSYSVFFFRLSFESFVPFVFK